MNIDLIPSGSNPPHSINVLIEVPIGGEPVKYEFDKASGAIFVDRILHTPMRYPCNYGYIHIDDIHKVSPHWCERIGHFFEHYKDLEKGKWVKLDGWGDASEAKKILVESMQRFEASAEKPNF